MGDWVGRRQGDGVENFVPLQPFLHLLSAADKSVPATC